MDLINKYTIEANKKETKKTNTVKETKNTKQQTMNQRVKRL